MFDAVFTILDEKDSNLTNLILVTTNECVEKEENASQFR